MQTIHPLKAFMAAATVEEQQLLAERAGTTRGQLYQLSGEHRQPSADLAGRIEAAACAMARVSKGRLPEVLRVDLCEACRSCPHAAKSLGARAVIAEFPIVNTKQLELDL